MDEVALYHGAGGIHEKKSRRQVISNTKAGVDTSRQGVMRYLVYLAFEVDYGPIDPK